VRRAEVGEKGEWSERRLRRTQLELTYTNPYDIKAIALGSGCARAVRKGQSAIGWNVGREARVKKNCSNRK
jgi:hypothetical protein